MKNNITITPLGVRGSVPTPDISNMKYGGNTSCFLVNINNHIIIFDCGTGISSIKDDFICGKYKCADIFISHCHFDHVMGIPFFYPFFKNDLDFRIYSENRYGKNIKEQIKDFMRAPFFPISSDSFKANIEYLTIMPKETIEIGNGINIETHRSYHPDFVTSFKLTYEGKSICYCLDYDHKNKDNDGMREFVNNCDLLIYDCQFTTEEYKRKVGWGHSTWQEGVNLAKQAKVGTLLLSHYNNNWTDDELDEIYESARKEFDNCKMAVEKKKIDI